MTGQIVVLDASAEVAAALARHDLPASMIVNRGDPSPAELRSMLREARIVLDGHTDLTAGDIAAAPHLRRIIFLGTGAASYIDLDAAARRGIAVDTIRNYGDSAVAQHALALALAALRQVTTMDRAIRAGTWTPLEGREFAELTFGIVGLGGIGLALGRMAGALGFRTVGWNRSAVEAEGVEVMPLDAVVASADILSLHLALAPGTRHLMDAGRIASMKAGAILVNTARGGLVDEAALAVALREGRLAHAALDVFGSEPLDPGDPLCALPNVTLTAHAAFKTRAATERLIAAAVAIVTAVEHEAAG